MSPEQKEALEKKVDKILGYLHNDHGTGEKGLVADFADLKRTVSEFTLKYEQDQLIKKRDLKWASTIFGIIGSIIVWILKEIASSFKGHG